MILKRSGISGACLVGLLFAVSACSGGSETAHDSAVEETDTGAAISVARTASLGMSCSGCHNDTGTALASLTGRDTATLITQITTYRDEAAGTTVMHRLARGYTDEEIEAIAVYLTNARTD